MRRPSDSIRTRAAGRIARGGFEDRDASRDRERWRAGTAVHGGWQIATAPGLSDPSGDGRYSGPDYVCHRPDRTKAERDARLVRGSNVSEELVGKALPAGPGEDVAPRL